MNYHYSTLDAEKLQLHEIVAPFVKKLVYFRQRGYEPHIWQLLFHCSSYKGCLTRYRHLVAGRRGGKTLSAAYEVAYYAQFPAEFHKDAHGTDSDRPLWIWCLAKDHKIGRPSYLTFRQVLRDLGLQKDIDYRENITDKYFVFPSPGGDTLVEFKSADDPENLRGAGLDILWIDESAIIPTKDAWNIVRPALQDKLGRVITTTTPQGKNWFYDEFWSEKSLVDPNTSRVEYRSLDNPYFPEEAWLEMKENYHPLLFRQEFMASFDSMVGRDLQGEWLHYYKTSELPRKENNNSLYDLKLYIGVDPAISLSDEADRFAMSLVGVDSNYQAYLLEQFAGRIPFPEQVDKVAEWQLKYRPEIIGIESTAYQAALVQQVSRLSSMPTIVPILTRGKKVERILSMAPVFRIGRVKIRQDNFDFHDEWLNYDSTLKNPKDDILDSTEIALRVAGALLPEAPTVGVFDDRPNDLNTLAKADRHSYGKSKPGMFDEHLGEVI